MRCATQIRVLAKGVQPDGEAPSGVILSGPAQSAAWRKFIQHPDRFKEHHLRPEDWWSDHFDSPLFFVLVVGDYVRETGDAAEAQRHWPRHRCGHGTLLQAGRAGWLAAEAAATTATGPTTSIAKVWSPTISGSGLARSTSSPKLGAQDSTRR